MSPDSEGRNWREWAPDSIVRMLHAVRVATRDDSGEPPILVYQMGKVGSSTVAASLKASEIDNPVFHIHFMTAAGLFRKLREYQRAGLLWSARANHAFTGLGLAARRRLFRPDRWLVITGVRDPIARGISSLFQTATYRHPELCTQGVPEVQAVLDFLHRHMRQGDRLVESTYRWLDRELKRALEIDPYEHPFDREQGYAIVESEDIRLLTYRLEDLGERLSTALAAFLETESSLPTVSRNVGSDKEYAARYRQVTRQFRLPEDRLRSLYDHRFMAHFYGPGGTERLIERWIE